MADQGQDLDRNEPATPHKLQKAHERGAVAHSAELTFALVLIVSLACVWGLAQQVLTEVALLLKQGLAFAGRERLSSISALTYMSTLGARAVSAVTGAILAVWLAAVLAAAMQARGVFSTQPLKPDLARLNPAAGFKRLLSLKSLHELWRSAARLVVLSIVMLAWGRQHLAEMISAMNAPSVMVATALALLRSELAVLVMIVLVFALLDWALARWEYLRNLRMSKREIKDEHKERDGDPRIKSRLRELRIQWLKRTRQLAQVRNADVLLTNPTHYAIALEYRHGEMPAPKITARGAGEMAGQMRAEARRRGVPVVEHPPLARALFAAGDQQSFVPEEHFEQVARILRWVYAGRRRA